MNHRVPHIPTAQSRATDPAQAASEVHAALAHCDPVLVIVFCSNTYEIEQLLARVTDLFGDVPVVGCTTAGEIGPAAYCVDSVVGVSLPAAWFTAVTGAIDQLADFELRQGYAFAQDLLREFEAASPGAGGHNSFAFLMIDGLSMREELVAHTLQSALGAIPLIGGSAGDGLDFHQTHVFRNGALVPNGAVLVLVTTSLPFQAFKTQHFIPGSARMVVTDADPAERLVREINGFPAAAEYARLTGLEVDDLDPNRFAASPVEVQIDGTDYVRSIQQVNPDGSLTFYCAIEEGLVLRVAQGLDLLQNLQVKLDELRADLGPLQLVLGCDCVLRGLEVRQSGLEDGAWKLLNPCNTVGFNTYGEQHMGVHVNQTLTGIAIGSPGGTGHG